MMKPLTPREREVAGLVARGLPNKRIAAELGVTLRTAKAHVEHIAMKLEGESPPRHRITVWFYSLDSDAA